MNVGLFLLDKFVPSFIRTAKIRELFRLTAAAFDVALPDLSGLTYEELLRRYARFARAESDKILGNPRRMDEVRSRLYKSAVATGLQLKDDLRIKNYHEILVASRIFYRILGITFSADTNGTITISKCFFSDYFSADTCYLISALDEGVASGLSGGELKFTDRITENKSCCRATLILANQKGGTDV
jgi:hypothetical protein